MTAAGPWIAASAVLLASLAAAGSGLPESERPISLLTFFATTPPAAPPERCLDCHVGIENMHPWSPLTCVECHGGDPKATSKSAAHVAPSGPLPGDERVVGLDADPAYRRFINPTDLRVASKTCGRCHEDWCSSVKSSLHGTTAGHLSDGLYENGVVAKRTAFGIFPVVDADGPKSPHALKELKAIPGFVSGKDDEIATHYRDVPRKSCNQCHLWSRGRAVRGRLGMDGDYRSEGCAACHVTYSDRGFSESADPTIDKREPGHPRKHEMTVKIPTETCTRCHYGDANIGLSFRGLAQLVPGQPAGPDVPGTTAERLNGTFYARDPAVTPPDVHHERGMHCIDCHTTRDVMGDGDIYPNMDHAVEVECKSCHGSFEARTDGRTERGARLPNLVIEGPNVWLTSKVTGARHRVKQARDVVDPRSSDFNARARDAMTGVHGKLECYSCHSGWNVNFFGFHFDRNESFTQLETMTGERTAGRVTTNEKVFATFKHLTLGFNHEGNVAPYLVGFSTFCSAQDKNGRTRIDHGMPRTAAGLSGMTMIHHQPHTTRPDARQCAECHRSGAAWGLGTGSFSLAVGTVFAATARGFAAAAIDRKTPDQSVVLGELRTGPAEDVAVIVDHVSGRARVAYLATASGLVPVDVAHPAFPEARPLVPIEGGLGRLLATDRFLYAAAGERGVVVFDLKDPLKPVVAARIPCRDARDLALAGLRLYVADGPHGLTIVDVADPRNPAISANLPVKSQRGVPSSTDAVAVHFFFSRPLPEGGRSRARQIAAVGGQGFGLRMIDVTEPSRPRELSTTPGGDPQGRTFRSIAELAGGRRPVALAFTTKYDLGSTGGSIGTAEHDDLYVLTRGEGGESLLYVLRATDPDRPEIKDRLAVPGFARRLAVQKLYSAPFLIHGAAVATDRGLSLFDLTRTGQGVLKATIPLRETTGLAIEAMPFDRMITEEGVALKDVAHEGARYANADELRRMLRAPIPDPAFEPDDETPRRRPPDPKDGEK